MPGKDLSNLSHGDQGRAINSMAPGSSRLEYMQAFAFGTGGETGGAMIWPDISVTDAGNGIMDAAIQLRVGRRIGTEADATVAPVPVTAAYRFQVVVREDLDQYDNTATQAVTYALSETGSGSALNATMAAGASIGRGKVPTLFGETNGTGAATVRFSRFRIDGTTVQVGAGHLEFYLLVEGMSADVSLTFRVILEGFDA